MRSHLPESFIRLADACPAPLYLVGGSVRDFLTGLSLEGADWDIASPLSDGEFISAAEKTGFTVRAVYPRTGTVKLQSADGISCEFTRFRRDRYEKGVHAPVSVTFTENIREDALRRDFRCNAVYYDIKAGEFADPLGGMEDIKEKKLRTTDSARKVFGEDGLRLMRLARQAAQTGFSPDGECLAGAAENASLLADIVPERLYAELMLLLHADEKRGEKEAPYRGLCILRETHVLKEILPELALGDGMAQNPRFHDHDVLEHSLRTVLYSAPSVRLAALLHDVGKPYCVTKYGNCHGHEIEGARIAEEILLRLKAPKAVVLRVKLLVRLHMRDLDGRMRENKLRRELVLYHDFLDELCLLKQADYTACKDDPSPAPTVLRWRALEEKMRSEGVPFTLKELAVGGREMEELGVPPQRRADVLETLLLDCSRDGALNERSRLLRLARRLAE